MAQTYLIQGGDVTAAVNGQSIGGVCELTVRETDDPHLIKEFLSDEPVAKIPLKGYEIAIKAHSADGCSWARAPVRSVAVSDGRTTDIFADCTVTELKTEVKPRGMTCYTVKIKAGKRGVSYG